jgi:hypothetical protein
MMLMTAFPPMWDHHDTHSHHSNHFDAFMDDPVGVFSKFEKCERAVPTTALLRILREESHTLTFSRCWSVQDDGQLQQDGQDES